MYLLFLSLTTASFSGDISIIDRHKGTKTRRVQKSECWSTGVLEYLQISNTPTLQYSSLSYFVPSCLCGDRLKTPEPNGQGDASVCPLFTGSDEERCIGRSDVVVKIEALEFLDFQTFRKYFPVLRKNRGF